MDRRQFLAAAGGVTGGLAGCLDSSDSDGSEGQWATGGGSDKVDEGAANASEVDTVSATQESSDCSTEQETIDQAMQALADAGVEGDTLDARIAALVSERDQKQSDKQAWQVRANDAADGVAAAYNRLLEAADGRYSSGQSKVDAVATAWDAENWGVATRKGVEGVRLFDSAAVLCSAVTGANAEEPGIDTDVMALNESLNNALAWMRWNRKHVKKAYSNATLQQSDLNEPDFYQTDPHNISEEEQAVEANNWRVGDVTVSYDVTSV
jgi:hypothetical protein